MGDYNRFKHLMARAARIRETIDCVNEKVEKAEAYQEIWQILNSYKTIEWDGAVSHVLDNWPDDNPDEGLNIIKALVEKGASIFEVNWENKPPLQVAVELEFPEPLLIKFLIKAKAPTDSPDLLEGFLKTHNKYDLILLSKSYIQVIKSLIRAGAPVPKRNVWHDDNIQNRIVVYELAKKMEMKRKYRELEKELKAAKDYIFELEHRPPELGGPEYEAARARWADSIVKKADIPMQN